MADGFVTELESLACHQGGGRAWGISLGAQCRIPERTRVILATPPLLWTRRRVSSFDSVVGVDRERPFVFRHLSGRPVDFDPLDFLKCTEPEVRDGGIVGKEAAARFELDDLVPGCIGWGVVFAFSGA